MLTPKDARDAERIAKWNETYGSTLGRVKNACGGLSAAIDRYESDPGPAQLAGLHAAAQHLADMADLELHTPGAGVPEYDGPRRDAVELWKRAGEVAGTWNPADKADDRYLTVARLLNEGTQRNAETDQFAKGLLARVRDHFG